MASRQFSSPTPKCSSTASERKKPGDSESAVTPVRTSSIAHSVGQTHERCFDEVVEDVASIAGKMPVDDFNDESAICLNHQGCRMAACDHVADQRLVEIGAHMAQVHFPESAWPVDPCIGSPHTVDQHIQPPGLLSDPSHEFRYLILMSVVYLKRDRFAAGLLNQHRGLVDCLRTVYACGASRGAAAGTVDQGAGRAQSPRNASPGAPGSAGHECDLTCQREFSDHFYRGNGFTDDQSTP